MRLLDELNGFAPVVSFRPRKRPEDPWVLACDAERLVIRLARSGSPLFAELPFSEILSKGLADYHTALPESRATYGLGLRLRNPEDTERLRRALRRDGWNLEMQHDRLLIEWPDLEPGLKIALAALPVDETVHTAEPSPPPAEPKLNRATRLVGLLLGLWLLIRCLDSMQLRPLPVNATQVPERQGASQVAWGESTWRGCGNRGRQGGFRFTALRQQRRTGGLYCPNGPYVIWDDDRDR